ncbi:MAG: universal stress protein [Cyanobacteria bacterium P01_A01_bin.84]
MLKKVLVALDESDITERVIQALHNLKFSSDSKVIFCHVFPPPESEMQLAADLPNSDSSAGSYLEVEKELQSYQAELTVDSELELVNGDPAEEIIRLANIYKVDLIIIGTRGLTGMKRIVQGSVSSQVMEDAHCSVLIVKSE